jgi:hypothetical protein
MQLKDIKSDYFYIDCVDNATLRECVKLLPFKEDMINSTSGGVEDDNKVIVVCDKETYLTVFEAKYVDTKIYPYTEISELKHLSKNN